MRGAERGRAKEVETLSMVTAVRVWTVAWESWKVSACVCITWASKLVVGVEGTPKVK